jgi:hypothetical protein
MSRGTTLSERLGGALWRTYAISKPVRNVKSPRNGHTQILYRLLAQLRFGDSILHEPLLGKTVMESYGTGNSHVINKDKALFFLDDFQVRLSRFVSSN